MKLPGPRAKLLWAIERLQALELECETHLSSHPVRVVPEYDQASGNFILRFRAPEEWPQMRWGLMVGDVVHNARSALDQAVWLIACRSNPVEKLWETDVGRKITFPITSSPLKFEKHRSMPYLADDAKELLQLFQPFHGGEMAEAVERLDRLWNIDKHRVIHGTTVSLDLSEVKFRPAAILIEDMLGDLPETTWHRLPNPIPDGTPVATVRFRDGRGPPDTRIDVTGEPTVTLAFGGGFFAMTTAGIGGLLVHTSRILALIETLPDRTA